MPKLRTDRATVASLCLVGFVVLATLSPVMTAAVAGQQSTPEADNTVTRIQIHPDGSATWTVRIRTRLDTDQRVSEYEAFQERFRSNRSRYLNPFRDRIRGVVATAADETGREMRAVNFTASTGVQEVPRRWGVVTYRFTWTSLADVRTGSIVVGDVFQGGFYLAANDSLEIEPPDGYELESVEPPTADRDAGVLTWSGREDFTDGYPRVVYAPSEQSADSSTVDETDPSTPAGSHDRGLVLGGVIVVVLVGAYAFWRRRDDADSTVSPATADPASDTDSRTANGDPEVLSTDAEILTDAERVQTLLAANGGRMKQAAIADELGWSASKISRVVGDMVDDGTVEKLQLGRENVIDLAADEP